MTRQESIKEIAEAIIEDSDTAISVWRDIWRN